MPILLSASSEKSIQTGEGNTKLPSPPVAARKDHRQVRQGATIIDPYFWLREKKNPEVAAYLNAENAYTAAATADLKSFGDSLYQEMLSRIKQTDLSVPVRHGDYLYYSRTVEGKQYPIQCRRKSDSDPEQIILDLNQLAVGYKFVGVGASVVSDDGNLLAYTVDHSGFRQYSLQVKDLRTGHIYPDTAPRVTSVAWASDNVTLLMTTEDEVTKRSHLLLRHKLGEPDFQTVYDETDELYDIECNKTRDEQFILLTINSKDTSEERFLDAHHPAAPLLVFLPREKGHRYYLDHRGELFYIRTNRGGRAKDFEVATATLDARAASEWKTFVPHHPGTLIEDIDLFQNFAVLVEKSEALDRLRFYRFDNKEWSSPKFAEPVFAVKPLKTPDFTSTTYRYSYESFITPPSIFDYDIDSGASHLLKRQEVLGGYNPGDYESQRLWATARDGVKVPISIVYKKGFKRDGQQPLFLYAYGSYGISTSAGFSSNRFSLVNRGMAFAIAHIRGGSEMGELWREDGMLMKKKNTFNDFVDSAQWLVDHQWTNPSKLVIEGGSAGGLLMGAVVNQRPDLFQAVHLAVPFVDVMNTMFDASLPLTVGEYLEWGNPNEKPAYDYMKSYSPYDNLEKRDYPAMLVTTSFNDSQVMYWEPAKYVARLRTLKTDSNPLLLKVKMDPASHGGASGRYDRLHDVAFEYAWMLSEVGIKQ